MAGTLLSGAMQSTNGTIKSTIDKTDANQQLASTINQGGLLMRMAKNQGSQQAGSRGLMNSSIGNEASQRAIVAAAQPLALQNTQFAQNKGLNQQQSDLTLKRDAVQQGYNKENMGLQFGYSTKLNDQQNTFTAGQNALDRTQQVTMENLQQKNRLGLLDAQGKQELQQLEKQFQNQTALNTQQNTFTSGQNALDRTQQTNLQNDAQLYGSEQSALDRAQQTNLQNDAQSFTYGQNALDRTQQTSLQNDAQSFTSGQNALDRTQQTNLQNDAQLFTYGQSALDRAQQSNLQNDAQSFTSGQNALDRTQQTNLTNLQFKNQTSLNTQQNNATTARDASLFGYDQKNKATDFANSLKTMSQQQINDLAKLNNQNTQQTAMAAKQQEYTLTNTAKQVAANTQGMYLEAINGLTSTFGDQVAEIQASAMKAEDKKKAVNSLISSQNAMLKFYQSTYQNMSTIKDDWINVDVKTLPSGTIANVK